MAKPLPTLKIPPSTKKAPAVSGVVSNTAVTSALTSQAPSQYQSLWHGTQTPTRIVIHDTEGDSAESAISTWTSGSQKLGAQIIIGPDGTITRVVPDDQKAWSTGGNNDGTLAIEIVGHAADSKDAWLAKSAQLKAVSEVIGYWSSKYNIPLTQSTEHGISTHAMNSALYPQSEGHQDPGPNFPLQQVLQAAGGTASSSANAPTGYDWEGYLANKLKIPYSADVKKFFDAWNTIDQSSAGNNPFNITIDYTGKSTGDLAGNTAGVKVFGSALDGLDATAAFILKRTPTVVSALKTANFKSAASAVGASGWAGSGAGSSGYGARLFQTFSSGAVRLGTNAPTVLSPADKAAVDVSQQTATATAKATDPGYLTAQEQLAEARIQGKVEVETQTKIARETAHLSDPWVTVLKDKRGNVTGFGQAFAAKPPADALLIGGQAATKSDLSNTWGATYQQVFEAYTGKSATPGEQAAILEQGISVYQLRDQLSRKPAFTKSPIYQESAAGIAAAAKTALGANPPKDFVRQAITQNWDANTIAAKIKALPGYTKGPEYKQNLAQTQATYNTIYGTATPEANAWLKTATIKGWSQDQVASKLRADPAYKYSPEYQSKALNFLDAMGLFTGSRPIAGPQDPDIASMNLQGSKIGAPKAPLQVGMGGQ